MPVRPHGANFTCHHPGVSHEEWPKNMMNTQRRKPARPFANRSKQWTSNGARPEPRGSQNAQRNYERYLALAQAHAQAGDIVGAENYYQHAEHYFRSMSSDRETT
jgi:Domain of unknown function (DUF4167)